EGPAGQPGRPHRPQRRQFRRDAGPRGARVSGRREADGGRGMRAQDPGAAQNPTRLLTAKDEPVMATTVFLDPDHSDAGLSGPHSQPAVFRLAAAPATVGETNTIRLPLVTVACWRMDDARFQFNSSFVMPTAKPELALLDKVVR